MKLGLFAVASVAALVVGSGTASAQPVIIRPAPVVVAPYSPGVTIGGTIAGRGFAIGGAYAPAPTVYAGPTIVPVVPVVGYGRPYYPPYGYYHHHHYPHYRW